MSAKQRLSEADEELLADVFDRFVEGLFDDTPIDPSTVLPDRLDLRDRIQEAFEIARSVALEQATVRQWHVAGTIVHRHAKQPIRRRGVEQFTRNDKVSVDGQRNLIGPADALNKIGHVAGGFIDIDDRAFGTKDFQCPDEISEPVERQSVDPVQHCLLGYVGRYEFQRANGWIH